MALTLARIRRMMDRAGDFQDYAQRMIETRFGTYYEQLGFIEELLEHRADVVAGRLDLDDDEVQDELVYIDETVAKLANDIEKMRQPLVRLMENLVYRASNLPLPGDSV